MLVDAHHAAEALAALTGAGGGVERKHLVVRFAEGDAIGFEARVEAVQQPGGIDAQQAFAVALEEGRFHRVGEAGEHVLLAAHAEAVYEEIHLAAFQRGVHHVLDAAHFAVHLQARETLLKVDGELFGEAASRPHPHGGEEREARALAVREGAVDDVLHRVALHLLSAHGREGVAHAGKEEAEVLVDFRTRPHGAPGIARRHLLFDGDGRGQALDVVALGLVHAAQKLAGVGR